MQVCMVSKIHRLFFFNREDTRRKKDKKTFIKKFLRMFHGSRIISTQIGCL